MKTNFALELKDDGDVDPSEVVTKALSDLNKTVDDRIKAIETKSADRLDKLEARINRPTAPKADNDNTEGEVEKKAFNTFIRGGVGALDDVERKTLNLTTQSAGGYVVVPGYSMKIVRHFRSAARKSICRRWKRASIPATAG
jgi:HK97 family phage major capsid protein